MAPERPDLAAALTDAARQINAPRTVEETLHSIVNAAKSSLPQFGHVGISEIRGDGTIETKAGTDPMVWELDDLQYRNDEGPCVDAIRGKQTVVSAPRARHEQRWPRYIHEAVRRGLCSQLAIQLATTDGQPLGGLNMYSTTQEDIDSISIDLAELFGVHAGIALSRARRENQLNTAMYTRQMIGQAIGIVMVRYAIDSERAFQFLVRASTSSNTKLRDVAHEVVTREARRHARPGDLGETAPVPSPGSDQEAERHPSPPAP